MATEDVNEFSDFREEVERGRDRERRRDALECASRVFEGMGAPTEMVIGAAEEFEAYLRGDDD